MEQSEELLISVICPRDSEPHAGTLDILTTLLVLTSKTAGVPIRAQGSASARLVALHKTLEDARDDQYREEHALHETVEKVFIAARFLAVDTEVEEFEFKRQIPSKHREGDRKPDPVEAAQPPKAAPKDIETEVQDILKNHLASQVEYVWSALLDSERRLREARSGTLSDAGSMDSDARGAARVRRMIKLTREVRGNVIDCASVVHNAMKRGAISDSGRWENFEDHASDGYSAATLEEQGWPMHE